ncbi:alpha/beta hydrolase [Bacillus salinus]|uniref:alpha/beta hydrolase n=1 Tax=Bacillus sp. HMF5848 TaxID=2495421 RepID=UPI0021AE1D0B|nr:alpha/beta hydrolase [Bacillus sp. HMF5848]
MELQTTKRMNLWKKILLGICSFLIFLVAAGVVYEAVSSYIGVKQSPPPGKLVNVGDFDLHIHKQGSGSPTIILETASGSTANVWNDIPKELAKFTTVVTYDRGGYGWSEKATTERTGENIVKELYTALKKENIEGPYIVAGHSLGGMYTRLFAQTYSDEVEGIVLIDARHEDYSKETNPILLAAGFDPVLSGYPAKHILTLLKQTGVIRLLNMGNPEMEESINIELRPKFFEAREAELRDMAVTEDAIRNQSLGDIPLRILTHGQPEDLTLVGLTQEQSQIMEDVWQQQQEQTLQISSNSQLIVAKNSGHYIIHDEPQLVIDVIKDVVDQIK